MKFLNGLNVSGNVGIGTNSPSYKLDVAGDINFSGTLKFGGITVLSIGGADVYANIRVIRNESTALNDGMYVNYNSTGGNSAHLRLFANGTTERMRIDASNGNVGIGTTSPTHRLTVTGGNVLMFPSDNTRQLSFFNDSYGITASSGLELITGDYIRFRQGSTELARLTTTGLGIGTTTPSAKLDVRGSSYRLSSCVVTKEFTVSFPNTISNQKVDFYMTGTQQIWGTIEVTVTEGYDYQNASGIIKKVYGVGVNPGGSIYSNEARYTEVLGATPDNWALSDLSWDAVNSRYKITLVHRVSTQNSPRISIKVFSQGSDITDSAATFTVGSVYTTDTTVYGRPYEYFNGNVGVGTTSPAYKLDVNGVGKFGSDAYSNLILNGTNASGWGNNIAFQSGGADFGYVGSIGSLLGNTTKDMTVWSTAGNGFRVYTNGNNKQLEITSTGAATFSSSVDATVFNSIRTSGYLFRENSGSGYGIYKNSTTEIGIASNGTVALNFLSTGAATFSSTVQVGGGGAFGYLNPKITNTVDQNSPISTVINNQFNGSAAAAYYVASTYGNSWYFGLGSSTSTYGNDFVLRVDGSADNAPYIRVNASNGAATFSSTITATGGNSTQWNTAYSWGNHASAGYWEKASTDDVLIASANVTFHGNVTVEGIFTETSSREFKENILPLEAALERVNQLEPVTYNKIDSDVTEVGLIAEDVASLFPEVVTYNEQGEPTGIQYQRLSVILLKSVQELTERIIKLENK